PKPYPVPTRWSVGRGARTVSRLTGTQHHQPGVEREPEDFVHFESAVLSVAGAKLDEREQRVVLVQHGVCGEMDDLLAGGEGTKCVLGRRRAQQGLRAITVCAADRCYLRLRPGERCSAWGERQDVPAPRRRRPLPEPQPNRGGRDVLEHVSLDEQLFRRPRS